MKRFTSTAQTPRPKPDEATRNAIEWLVGAKEAIDEIVEVRRREKLSTTRAAHVGREVGEIIKVLSLYLPNEVPA